MRRYRRVGVRPMKPTLGHPSRTAAIQALRRERKTEGEIARLIGIKPNTVSSLLARAKKRGSAGRGSTPRLRLRGELLLDLAEAAEARGVSPAQLAEQILRAVIADDLYAAVLET